MGDIFRREIAQHPEPFTGERLTTAVGGQVQIEHYHRYLFARSLVAGLDVLDLASGEGYGSALLAQVANTVLGIEYSGPTVRSAAANFPRPNLHFLQGDARELPLRDACFDAVVSFETIEHFDRQNVFVREVHRVLRDNGIFIVSTPDRDVYSPAGTSANQYHVRELSRSEFIVLLRERFRCVQVMQQRPVMGSALLADSTSSAPPLVFDRRGETHFEACIGLPRAPYLFAIASDRELPALPPSLYIDRSDLDTEALHSSSLAAQLRQAQADLAQAKQLEAEAIQSAVQATQSAAQATQREQDAMQRADQAARHAEHAKQELQALQYVHETLQGSLRTFLRGYLPLLCNHVLRQRP